MEIDSNFWSGKKVLITGHTGFKGCWLSLWLEQLGAEVYGYSLSPETNPNLYELVGVPSKINSTIGDIRDASSLASRFEFEKPEIVFHLAAQSLVRKSYIDPIGTYQTNILGTANILEAMRAVDSVKACVVVTTDKCYENREQKFAYGEEDRLGGYDPYSSSKACAELITASYRQSYFNPADYKNHNVAIATARAGNVIGGGDWAEDRLVPDILNSFERTEKVIIRNPTAIRPWQHVLEPLSGYLKLAEKLYSVGVGFGEAWNFGPNTANTATVETVVKELSVLWGEDAQWGIDQGPNQKKLHEAGILMLDSTKAKQKLNWQPKFELGETLKSIVDWHRRFLAGENTRELCLGQIEAWNRKKVE